MSPGGPRRRWLVRRTGGSGVGRLGSFRADGERQWSRPACGWQRRGHLIAVRIDPDDPIAVRSLDAFAGAMRRPPGLFSGRAARDGVTAGGLTAAYFERLQRPTCFRGPIDTRAAVLRSGWGWRRRHRRGNPFEQRRWSRHKNTALDTPRLRADDPDFRPALRSQGQQLNRFRCDGGAFWSAQCHYQPGQQSRMRQHDEEQRQVL